MHGESVQRRVLITGAAGKVGRMLTSRLHDRYDFILAGRHGGRSDEGIEIREVDMRDFAQVRLVMDGVDTVVHLAGDASPQATWESVLENNIVGTRNVLEAARDANVRRVVFASSNHAMGMYDRESDWPVYNTQQPRPDSLYGVSKVFGETIGRFYHDEYGLEFIALRIGWSTEEIHSTDADVLRAMWLSPDDTAQVIRCAIEAKVPFGIYYAVSDNPNRRWDMTDTMLDLGYRPKDRWEETLGETERVVEGGVPADPAWPDGT